MWPFCSHILYPCTFNKVLSNWNTGLSFIAFVTFVLYSGVSTWCGWPSFTSCTLPVCQEFFSPSTYSGACGGAVGWGNALQAGRLRVQFPMVSLEFFHWHNLSGRTMALGLPQPLKEMSTRNISWGVKAAGAYGWQLYHLHVPIVLKSGSLSLLEPSRPFQACNGIALQL